MMITEQKALDIAKNFVKERTDLLAPKKPRLLLKKELLEKIKQNGKEREEYQNIINDFKDHWVIEFPFDFPEDIVVSPSSLLVCVYLETQEAEVFKSL